MTDPVGKAQELLKEHRASIDRLDAVLVYTLAERFAEADLNPEFAKKFLNFIIQEVIQHHKQHQS